MPDTPVFAHAAVAAPHLLAAETGQHILAQGGNALEAMVAMAATIAVVYPHNNALGGDGFWLVADRSRRVRAIEACGPAGSLATIRAYRERGHDAIPARGPLAALTVPGAVAGWQIALDMARAFGGKMPLDVLMAEAAGHALRGFPVSSSQARVAPATMAVLAEGSPGFGEVFFAQGKPLGAGETLLQPALGATLQQLAHAGLGDFYRGDVGREIAADLSRAGAPVTRQDLARYEARLRQPLSMALEGCTLFNTAPPTQGLASLVTLGIFERLNVRRAEGFDHIHGLVEATKRANALRDRIVTDPAFSEDDPAACLEPAFLEREAAAIDRRRAAPLRTAAAEGDTIWMGAIDENGLVVSYIQSLFRDFGSGLMLPRTGVLMQNRGTSFSLDQRSRNPLAPGRLPFHTLTPALALFDDGAVMAYGTMGGEAQPQIQAQIFSRIRFGASLAAAIDAPRFRLGLRSDGADLRLHLEARFEEDVARALRAAGHPVKVSAAAYADAFGHAGAVLRDRRGDRIAASHDPRSDGGALGL